MNQLGMPDIASDTITTMEDMSLSTHSLIFDDLLIVAQKETNYFVLKTEDGLIVMDAIWSDQGIFDTIVNAVKEIRWDPDTIQKLALTRGHADHTGCGRWLVKQYHVDIYLSKEDEIFWKEHPVKSDRPETWKDYEIDHFFRDGDTITLGRKTTYVYGTPGHTPGYFSYVFPVEEDGGIHMTAPWGGTTPPWGEDGVNQYLESLDYFADVAMHKDAGVILSNYTAIDNDLKRIAYSRERLSCMSNIYITEPSGTQKYFQVFRTMSDKILKSQEDNTNKE